MRSSVLACRFSERKAFLPKFINNNPFLKKITMHTMHTLEITPEI